MLEMVGLDVSRALLYEFFCTRQVDVIDRDFVTDHKENVISVLLAV
jgi:hypothetical protein